MCEHWPSTSDPESTVIGWTPSASQGSGWPACLSSLEACFHGYTPLRVAELGEVKAAAVQDPIMAFGGLHPGADPPELHGNHRASPGHCVPTSSLVSWLEGASLGPSRRMWSSGRSMGLYLLSVLAVPAADISKPLIPSQHSSKAILNLLTTSLGLPFLPGFQIAVY